MDPSYMSRIMEWETESENEGVAFLTNLETMEQRLKIMSIQLEKLKILQAQYVLACQEQLRQKSSLPVNQASNQYAPESMFFMDRTFSADAAHRPASYDTSHTLVNSTFRTPQAGPLTNVSLFDSQKMTTMQNVGFASSTPYNPRSMVQMKPLVLTSELFTRELPSQNYPISDDVQNKLVQNRRGSGPGLSMFVPSNVINSQETQKEDLNNVNEAIINKFADTLTISEKRAVEEVVCTAMNVNAVTVGDSAAETERRQEEHQQNDAASVIVSGASQQYIDDGSYYSPPRRKIEIKHTTPIKKLIIPGEKKEEQGVSVSSGEMTDKTTSKPERDVPISDQPTVNEVEIDKSSPRKSNKQKTGVISTHEGSKPKQEKTEEATKTSTGMATPDKNTKKDPQSPEIKAQDLVKEQTKIAEKDKKTSKDPKVSKNVSSKSLGSLTSTESDESLFDGNLSLTSSAAYKSMLGAGDLSTKPSKVIEESPSDSDSEDDVERALAMAVNKNKPKLFNESASMKSPVKNAQLSSSPSSANKSKQDDMSEKKNKTSTSQAKPRSMRPSISASSSSKIKFSKATRQALGLDSESDEAPRSTKKPQKEESDDEFDFYD